MSVKDCISKICPSATFEEGDILLVNVPAENWRKLAEELKHNPELNFDVLTAVVGMDWKESLGVVYYFTATSHKWEMLSVKVAVADRENPYIHTVSDLWKVANFQEREVYDFFGIKFIGHPDMRRFFLRNDWKGFPLRKDYDANPALNPIPTDDEKNEDDTISYVEQPDGTIKG
ncbi:MAG: NADH-quinone oxidoreductase subunit C, partial [Muribaculaceae bacterium]|nr:NADH-quinone oxidoreductase subunit C [Muribaculaceae bacterium]